jgi:membrane-bound serine protease (ClpP class)
LAIAGIICLTFGTLTLVAAPVQEMAISPWVALAVSAAFGSITVFLVRLAVRARRLKSRLGPSSLVGCSARAMEALNPEGHVLVEGEIWRAVSSMPVPAGAPLRVVSLDKYLLHVEPAQPQRTSQSPA